MNIIDREKQIPNEFKTLAKDFADKGFIRQLLKLLDLSYNLFH